MAQTQKSTRDVAGTANSASCWAQIKWQANKPRQREREREERDQTRAEFTRGSRVRVGTANQLPTLPALATLRAANWQILKCEFLYTLTFARCLGTAPTPPPSWSIILTMKMASGFWRRGSLPHGARLRILLPAFSLRRAHIN